MKKNLIFIAILLLLLLIISCGQKYPSGHLNQNTNTNSNINTNSNNQNLNNNVPLIPVSIPTIYPDTKTFEAETYEVTLECSTNGAIIYYTIDGSTPTQSSQVYNYQPIELNQSVTFKAKAFNIGMAESSVAEKHYDLYWWIDLGSGINNGWVNVVAINNNGDVYAGGSFTSIGGDSSKKHIAYWNGSSWNAMDNGVNAVADARVYAITFDNNNYVYVGGDFTEAGSTPIYTNDIAKWDGSAWSSLGTGSDGQIYALEFDGLGNLFVGGYFNSINGVSSPYIAKYNGSWSDNGGSLDGGVYSLFNHGGNVYVGGVFSNANGLPDADMLAITRTGSVWGDIAGGLNTYVRSVVVDSNNQCYVGGNMKDVSGDISKDYLLTWSHGNWELIGWEKPDAMVRTLCVYGDKIYAGGDFTHIGSQQMNYVARWDGKSWTSLGDGVNGTVYSIAADDQGDIYLGCLGDAMHGSRIIKWGKIE